MVTTSRLLGLDAVESEGTDLIHLTGSLQVDLRFDATRVRGVGLKTGARFWVEGVHQSRHEIGEFSAPFDVVACFELRGCVPGGSRPASLTLTVSFRVTVPEDGRATVTAGAVELLPPIERQQATRLLGSG